MEPCYNKCREWDDHYKFEFTNSDNVCCEIMMEYDKTICSFYIEGANDRVKQVKNQRDFQNRAVNFKHSQ